jgi:hypothetical protein
MSRLLVFLIIGVATTGRPYAQQIPPRTRAPRLWTNEALAGWALPIAGVNATPQFFSEAEYYAAPVDELRTYPAYIKGREPKGYREWMRKQGPKPLIEIGKSRTDAEWIAAGLQVFDGMDIPENRTGDPRAIGWFDDPAASARDRALVTKEGIVIGVRWVMDRDNKLKVTLNECAACHTRVLPDGSAILARRETSTSEITRSLRSMSTLRNIRNVLVPGHRPPKRPTANTACRGSPMISTRASRQCRARSANE